MENMEYNESLGHYIRSAPRKIRRKIFWALVADYAIWFFAGLVAGRYLVPLLWQ